GVRLENIVHILVRFPDDGRSIVGRAKVGRLGRGIGISGRTGVGLPVEGNELLPGKAAEILLARGYRVRRNSWGRVRHRRRRHTAKWAFLRCLGILWITGG